MVIFSHHKRDKRNSSDLKFLLVKNDEITNGNSWIVEYYETEEDALDGTNVILDPEAYTNTAVGINALNPQTLFVRVTDPATTCYSFVTLTIRVLPNPTPSIDPWINWG